MANWSLPTLTDLYTNFRQYLSDRLDDAAKMFDSATTTPTNQPVGTKRWNSTANKFEKWDGSAWSDLASTYSISISGNASTATTAATATNVTTVTSANVIAGLGYAPLNKAGGTVTGALSVAGLIYGGSGLTIAGSIYASGSIHTEGAAQFDSTVGVSGAVTVGGGITVNGPIVANNNALRANGWGGNPASGVVYFGNTESYIYKETNTFRLAIAGVGEAVVTKGGTVAMTSDIPAAGIPYGVGSDSVGATIMAIYSGPGTPVIDTDVSGGYLTPCNTAGTVAGSVRSGTWRCRGNTSLSTNKITIWFKIA